VVVVGGDGRGAGLSSCTLSIIHDLTLGKTEEGRWTGVREETEIMFLNFSFCLKKNKSRRGK